MGSIWGCIMGYTKAYIRGESFRKSGIPLVVTSEPVLSWIWIHSWVQLFLPLPPPPPANTSCDSACKRVEVDKSASTQAAVVSKCSPSSCLPGPLPQTAETLNPKPTALRHRRSCKPVGSKKPSDWFARESDPHVFSNKTDTYTRPFPKTWHAAIRSSSKYT